MPLICFYYQISASFEKMFLLKSVLLSLIKYMNALIKNLIKVWFRRCKKKLLSVISCHCPDKAIYTDLFTLTPGEKDPQFPQEPQNMDGQPHQDSKSG